MRSPILNFFTYLKMKTSTDIDPLHIIEILRDSHPNIYNAFMEGSCFRFCMLLDAIFNEDVQRLLYSQKDGHWIIQIGDDYYDIGGVISADYVAEKDYEELPEAHESAYLASAGRSAPYTKYAATKVGSLLSR